MLDQMSDAGLKQTRDALLKFLEMEIGDTIKRGLCSILLDANTNNDDAWCAWNWCSNAAYDTGEVFAGYLPNKGKVTQARRGLAKQLLRKLVKHTNKRNEQERQNVK